MRGALLQSAIIAGAYAALALLGLTWAAYSGAVSPVWPAAGAALAGLLLTRARLWPFVSLGAIAAMVLAGDELSWPARLGIGFGNGLAAVLGVLLCRRLAIRLDLRRPRDFLALLAGGGTAALLAASSGVAALTFSGVLPQPALASAWLTWALGDLIGVVIMAPLVLAWIRGPRLAYREWFILTGVVAMTAGVSFLIFDLNVGPLVKPWHVWPMLVAAAVVAGLRGATTAVLIVTATALAGVLLGYGPFPEVERLTDRLLVLQQFIGLSAATVILLAVTLDDLKDRQRTIELQRLLAGELEHRIKNLIMVVQSISNQTIRSSDTLQDYRTKFFGRLAALGRVHALIVHPESRSSGIRDILESTLGALEGGQRVRLDGPDVGLTANQAVGVSLAAHELATNALKYGALSVPDGTVDVRWTYEPRSGAFELLWTERGGPPVEQPVRRGFGSTLIGQALAHEADHAVEVSFHAEGLVCRIVCTLARVEGAEEDTFA